MKKIVLLTAVMIAALASAACAGCIGADPIVGEWSSEHTLLTVNDDGTGNIHAETPKFLNMSLSIDYPITWTKSESTYIISVGNKEGSKFSGKYTLSEDKKTLNGPITFVKKA